MALPSSLLASLLPFLFVKAPGLPQTHGPKDGFLVASPLLLAPSQPPTTQVLLLSLRHTGSLTQDLDRVAHLSHQQGTSFPQMPVQQHSPSTAPPPSALPASYSPGPIPIWTICLVPDHLASC